MKGTTLYGPRAGRLRERKEAQIREPISVIVCMAATCVCGSDLWLYRGIGAAPRPH